MCGDEGSLKRVKIEGTIMNVCSNCQRYGEIIRTLEKPKRVSKQRNFLKPEIVEGVRGDYAHVIRDARDKIGMKQEDFAKKINERLSIIHNIETGHFKPSLVLAKKIERFLGIKLIETESNEEVELTKSKESGGFTLGDMIKK